MKFNDYTKPATIRCANLSDRAVRARVRNETDGVPFPSGFQDFDPHPRLPKKSLKGQWLRMTSARAV
jgi:hypothetical protein